MCCLTYARNVARKPIPNTRNMRTRWSTQMSIRTAATFHPRNTVCQRGARPAMTIPAMASPWLRAAGSGSACGIDGNCLRRGLGGQPRRLRGLSLLGYLCEWLLPHVLYGFLGKIVDPVPDGGREIPGNRKDPKKGVGLFVEIAVYAFDLGWAYPPVPCCRGPGAWRGGGLGRGARGQCGRARWTSSR